MIPLKRVGAGLVLLVSYVVLFSVAGQLLTPAALLAKMPTGTAAEAASLRGMAVMAVIDVAFIVGVVLTSRLRGVRVWLLTSAVYWGAKTFTGQLEAWYFMPNVDAGLVPSLMLLTVPVALVVPLLAVVLFGRFKGAGDVPGWRVPPMGPTQQLVKWGVLSAVVYPALFFTAGYYIAYSSEEVRAFYGGIFEPSFLAHMAAVLRADPKLLPFEMLRGALWVAMAVAVLWTTRGKGWLGGLWVVLLFTLVQNGVHLLPNPLMPPTVQRFHFIETVSSNAVFAVAVVWSMRRAHTWGRPLGRPRPTDAGPSIPTALGSR